MPTKPTAAELNAAKVMRANPNFGHDVLEAVINDTPELREALLREGLVEEVKSNG